MENLVILVDDERSFKPGVRDEALTLRGEEGAREAILAVDAIDELWLDFVLAGSEDVSSLLMSLQKAMAQGAKLPEIRKVYLHSSSSSGDELLKHQLNALGVDESIIERVWDRGSIFDEPKRPSFF